MPILAVFPAATAFCASTLPLWPLDGTSKSPEMDSNHRPATAHPKGRVSSCSAAITSGAKGSGRIGYLLAVLDRVLAD